MKRIRSAAVSAAAVMLSVLAVLTLTFTVKAADADKAAAITAMQKGLDQWQKSQDSAAIGTDSSADWLAFAAVRRSGAVTEAQIQSLKKSAVRLKAQEADKAPANASDWQRLALLSGAFGLDAEALAADEDGSKLNLIAGGIYDTSAGDPGRQGLNGYIWALMVLQSDEYQVPPDSPYTKDRLVQMIESKQNADGSFGLQDGSEDIDITAMAVTALPEDPASQRGLAWLGQQTSSQGISGEAAETTAWTLIAVCSKGEDPGSLIAGLKSFGRKDGGFSHLRADQQSNEMATAQAALALESCRRYLTGEPALFDLKDASAAVIKSNINADEKNVKAVYQYLLPAAAVILLLSGTTITVIIKRRHRKNRKHEESEEW